MNTVGNTSGTVNQIKLTNDGNLKFVKDYQNPPSNINGNEWDYVLGFFMKSMSDPKSAANIAQQIFEISRQTEVSPLEIVDSMKGQTGLELNASLAYYMNGIRSNTSLLGLINTVKPNFYAGRSVLI